MNDLPDLGDLVWADFIHRLGHEQKGRRPAIVISPGTYHKMTGLALVCPITSNISPYPLKVILPEGLQIKGAILVDQINGVECRTQLFGIIGRAPVEVVAEVQAKLSALLGIT